MVNRYIHYTLQEGTFRDSRIRELYLSDCDILDIDSSHFSGLETSLEHIDFSGNNITSIPEMNFFQQFDFLRTLILHENHIETYGPGI